MNLTGDHTLNEIKLAISFGYMTVQYSSPITSRQNCTLEYAIQDFVECNVSLVTPDS